MSAYGRGIKASNSDFKKTQLFRRGENGEKTLYYEWEGDYKPPRFCVTRKRKRLPLKNVVLQGFSGGLLAPKTTRLAS
jgi:hypothetical protein